jgi:hypothetical protein
MIRAPQVLVLWSSGPRLNHHEIPLRLVHRHNRATSQHAINSRDAAHLKSSARHRGLCETLPARHVGLPAASRRRRPLRPGPSLPAVKAHGLPLSAMLFRNQACVAHQAASRPISRFLSKTTARSPQKVRLCRWFSYPGSRFTHTDAGNGIRHVPLVRRC